MNTNEAIRRVVACLAILLFVSAAGPAGAEEPQLVASADGTPISYEVHGSGEPTLVLVHGWNCDASYWREQVPHFSKSHRLVLVDIAAHGRSGATRELYTMRAFGEDVRAVVDAVGGDEFILVGHSMGGAIVAEAARLMPGRVVGLIGIDTLENIEHPLTKEDVDGMAAPFEADFVAACRDFAGGMILPDTDPKLREWILADMSSAPPASAISALREYMTQHVTGEKATIFEEIHCPVVTVNAGIWPVDHEANRRHMHSFDAIILEGSDHFMMLTRTNDFNRAFEDAIGMVTMKATTESQILDAEERLRAAMLASDVATLDQLLSPDLVFTNHLGMVLGKQDDLGAHEAGIVDITELELSDSRIRILGETVVVTAQVNITGTFQGEPASGVFRFTRVWARNEKGNWQVVAGHSSVKGS